MIRRPPAVLALAARLGATLEPALSRVSLRQTGLMRDHPGARDMAFKAAQTIDLNQTAFEWRASTGPFGCVAVTDAFRNEIGALDVRVLGLIPLAHLAGGGPIAKGEVMRYLAELAWAPDAILRNPFLTWVVVNAKTLRVSAGHGTARGEVELRLDADGRIAEVVASGRPRLEGKLTVERPWAGAFSDYRRHQGRWIPFAGEVSWTLEGMPFVYWQGRLTSWVAT